MSLDTTTTDPVAPAAPQDEPQLDANEEHSAAVAENEDTSQTSESVDTEPRAEAEAEAEDDSEEAELKEWAAKKNLPLDNPLAMAKMVREADQKVGKKGHEQGQLKKAVTEANTNAGVDDVQSLRNEVTALNFKIEHPEARELEPLMVQILDEKPWLASDLDAVLDIAKGRSVSQSADVIAARQAGGKEALAQAEKAARAAQPRASATQPGYENKSRITPENVDEVVGRHVGDTDWYKKHLPEINAALGG
jgi:hypothetical protein